MSKKKTNKKDGRGLLVTLIILALVLVALVIFLITREPGTSDDSHIPGTAASVPTTVIKETFAPVTTETAAAVTEPAETETNATEPDQEIAVEERNTDLGQDLELVDFGSYTGIYMEDGSDEMVVGVAMIMVTNHSDLPLQYAEIEMTLGEQTAYFSVSTLPAGASAVLLEKNRLGYEEGMTVDHVLAKNVTFFDAPLNLNSDKVRIQALNGAMNIMNISGEAITEDIVIYYKNSSSDMFYGGITYRVRLEGGLAADEIRQIMSDHFSDTGSTILFVTCG